ncbi:ATP-binding protein [Paenibacillus soyae]|uniref:histidine kinase n=1 Tax=Paenibacillus soyae TaxID=2969249 RepID=A0A9X2SDS0_9BACL|nr:ATP-binding protein [Paenibacillus soyae]MCR2807382.1 ATP-binding protein [Paenibacillus soyae]
MSVSNGSEGVTESDLALDRLASVGQIAMGIAHEVKNPLTAVKGFLQLMMKNESSHKYLDYAYTELENALDTLQNLLHVSKPDMENEPIDAINLSAELEALLYLFQEQSYQIAIHKQFADTSVRIYGKRNQLKKALFNLLKNAFEAIEDEGSITIKHYVSDQHLMVSVADTGVGIPQEKINMLGTPFYTSKTQGTGMGLAQVFSSVYEHSGKIRVRSEVGSGTEFALQFPIENTSGQGDVIMNLIYTEGQNFSQFYSANQESFMQALLLQGQGREVLDKVREADPEDVLESARKIVALLNGGDEHGLITHAKERGRSWASYHLDLISKLDWIQLLRRTYWHFLCHYCSHVERSPMEFFELERQVNDHFDLYLKHFASSYSEYHNESLLSQREVIEELSVPVIPLFDHLAILPIVGTLDALRAKRLQEQILVRIYEMRIKHIVIDLSGAAFLDADIVSRFFKIVNGIAIQGCKATITGIHPEMTKTILELGIALHEKIETRTTLQQAIEEYGNA